VDESEFAIFYDVRVRPADGHEYLLLLFRYRRKGVCRRRADNEHSVKLFLSRELLIDRQRLRRIEPVIFKAQCIPKQQRKCRSPQGERREKPLFLEAFPTLS
jgi:hypothetical protein